MPLRRPQFNSIETQLPLSTTLLLATVIAAAMGFAYVQVRHAAVSAERDRLERVSKQVTDLLQASLASLKGLLWRDAQKPALRRFLTSPDPQSRREALAVLEAMRATAPQMVDVRLWDTRGVPVLSVGVDAPPVPPNVRDELRAPLPRGDSAIVGSLHLVADMPVWAAAAPVLENGRTIGYLVERGRPASSSKAARGVADLVGHDAGVYIGNARGDVWTDFWTRIDAPPAGARARGQVVEYERRGAAAGAKYAVERAVSGTPWVLVVEFPRELVLAPVRTFVSHATAFALALLLVGAIGLSILSYSITRPLSDLREAAVAMTAGDYSRRLHSDRMDELGQLSRAFDEMASRVAQAQRSLRRELASVEGQYRVLVDGIQDYAIFMLDRSGNVVSWTKGAERIKGYRADEIIGRHFSTFYSAQEIEARKPWNELEVARAEGRFEEEGWRLRRDGSRIWANVVITALRDDTGSLVGFAKVTRDISEKRRVAEAQAAHTRDLQAAYADLERHRLELKVANEDLESFTYSVSHDLRAPIRQIEGFSTILGEHLRGNADPEAAQYLRRIRDGSQQMGRLVDDLLHLAQVGRRDPRPHRTALDPLVGNVVARMRSDIADRHVEWRVTPLPIVACDPGLLEVVFTNLLANAVKYTRSRERAVIEVGQTIRDGRPVIYVRDNGVGFDMQYADKLFGVFQRLHRAEEFEGTGIGLSIVHRIIRKHAGRIWADARPDAGATFYFTIGETAISDAIAPNESAA